MFAMAQQGSLANILIYALIKPQRMAQLQFKHWKWTNILLTWVKQEVPGTHYTFILQKEYDSISILHGEELFQER